jgi:hypothetical protein
MTPEDLATLKTTYSALVVKYSLAVANASPDYKLEGQEVSFSKYMLDLQKQIQDLRQIIIDNEGPWELPMVGVS